MRSLASVAGTVDGKNIPALLQGAQGSFSAVTPIEMSQKPLEMPFGSASKVDGATNPQAPLNSVGQCPRLPIPNAEQTRTSSSDTDREGLQSLSGPASTNPLHLTNGLKAKSITEDSAVGRIKFNKIDLNTIYDDSQDDIEDPRRAHLPGTSETVYLDSSLCTHHDSHKSSPPQPSWNSDSTTTQSPSTSSGEAPVCSVFSTVKSPIYNCLT